MGPFFNPQMPPFLVQSITKCRVGNWTVQFQPLLRGGRGRTLLIIFKLKLWRTP